MSTLSYIKSNKNQLGSKKIKLLQFQAKEKIKELRHEFTKIARLERMILGQPKKNKKSLRTSINTQNSILKALSFL